MRGPNPRSLVGQGGTVYRRARLLLVRHGQTDWNLEGRWQGSSEVPLNATGREEVERIAADLVLRRIDAVYSSPLSRSLDTARAIAQRQGLEVWPDARLREIGLGRWEGMLSGQIAGEYPALHRQWCVDPRPVRPPGGETIREVHDRVVAAVEEIAYRHSGGVLCLVTHKTAIVVIRCHYLGLELPAEMGKMPPNAACEVLEVELGPRDYPCCSASVCPPVTVRGAYDQH